MEHVVEMWNGDGGTVWYNSGTVLVVKWNSDGGTVEQWWWKNGTEIVEECWWNSVVEHCNK